jgi:hypothetical protein
LRTFTDANALLTNKINSVKEVIAKLKDKFEIAQRKLPISNLWWLFVTIYRVIVSREGFCPDFSTFSYCD